MRGVQDDELVMHHSGAVVLDAPYFHALFGEVQEGAVLPERVPVDDDPDADSGLVEVEEGAGDGLEGDGHDAQVHGVPGPAQPLDQGPFPVFRARAEPGAVPLDAEAVSSEKRAPDVLR